jgi:hypothetical protein
MTSTFERICELVALGQVRISDHGYDELAEDGILVREALSGLEAAEIVEDYPDFPKGPCVLVLHRDAQGQPVHAVWGIPRGQSSLAVLVTAYRPDPKKWSADLKRRRR